MLDQCCLSGNAFSLFLHQNYLLFFDGNPVTDIATASDYLSLSDLMNSPGISCDPSSGAATSLDFYEGTKSRILFEEYIQMSECNPCCT